MWHGTARTCRDIYTATLCVMARREYIHYILIIFSVIMSSKRSRRYFFFSCPLLFLPYSLLLPFHLCLNSSYFIVAVVVVLDYFLYIYIYCFPASVFHVILNIFLGWFSEHRVSNFSIVSFSDFEGILGALWQHCFPVYCPFSPEGSSILNS